MRKLLPILLAVIGIAAGAGAGIMLRPAEEVACEEEPCEEKAEKAGEGTDDVKEDPEVAYVRMKNQFVVPVVRERKVSSLVVLSLSIETGVGQEEAIYAKEPKLRDVFLRVLFDHAHIGGFDGAFTESGRMSLLRIGLLEAAQSEAEIDASDILITDIVRQEM